VETGWKPSRRRNGAAAASKVVPPNPHLGAQRLDDVILELAVHAPVEQGHAGPSPASQPDADVAVAGTRPLRDVLHFIREVPPRRRRRQRLAILAEESDHFIHDPAQLREDIQLVVSMAPSVEQTWGTAPSDVPAAQRESGVECACEGGQRVRRGVRYALLNAADDALVQGARAATRRVAR